MLAMNEVLQNRDCCNSSILYIYIGEWTVYNMWIMAHILGYVEMNTTCVPYNKLKHCTFVKKLSEYFKYIYMKYLFRIICG